MDSGPVHDLKESCEEQIQQMRAQTRTSQDVGGQITSSRNLDRAAQDRANKIQSGILFGVIPEDDRTPLARAQDGTVGAWTGDAVKELVGYGATSVFEIVEAWAKDKECKAAILDKDANEMGVGVGGGENSLYLVALIGHRGNAPTPDTPGSEQPEIESRFTGEELLSMPGRQVQVFCE